MYKPYNIKKPNSAIEKEKSPQRQNCNELQSITQLKIVKNNKFLMQERSQYLTYLRSELRKIHLKYIENEKKIFRIREQLYTLLKNSDLLKDPDLFSMEILSNNENAFTKFQDEKSKELQKELLKIETIDKSLKELLEKKSKEIENLSSSINIKINKEETKFIWKDFSKLLDIINEKDLLLDSLQSHNILDRFKNTTEVRQAINTLRIKFSTYKTIEKDMEKEIDILLQENSSLYKKQTPLLKKIKEIEDKGKSSILKI